jgi:eukaryotic-like serine/threonine-protein kinase
LPRDTSQEEMGRFWREMRTLHSEFPVPALDSPLVLIIQRCLEKAPARRFQSFEKLRADLETLLQRQTGDFVKLPDLGESQAWEYANRGASLNALRRFEEALRCCDKALNNDARLAGAWYNKGNSLVNLHRVGEALRCYNRALALDPQIPLAWNNKGLILDMLGRYQEAIRCYDCALELDTRIALAWYNKGNSLFSLHHLEESVRCYDQALGIDPEYAKAWMNKALTEEQLGRRESAARSFKRLIDLPLAQDAVLIEQARQRLREIEGA